MSRGFAPYVGLSLERLHGNRADQACLVAGIRLRF
ncbi:hypothetical protein ACIPZ5_26265 [Pseudomonas sp. NPDC089428]